MKYSVMITMILLALWPAVSSTGEVSPVMNDGSVSLNFDDTPISAILKMLAVQNSLNLVVSSDIEGDISITLENVTLSDALNAILLPNGYNYFIINDIIIVKRDDKYMAGELMPQTYRLNYIDAGAAMAAVTPLLSNKGQVIPLAISGEAASEKSLRGSTIIVVDFEAVQTLVRELLSQIDYRRRQITVEVKIIETNLSKDEKLGINWPKSIGASINGAPPPAGYSSGDNIDGQSSNAAIMPLEDGNWQLGYLTVDQVNLVLDYLQQRDNSKLLSNPRVTTMEDETAIIEVQTIIPIQTINRFSEGAVIQDIVTFQDEEVGISLKVTPRINNDSTLTLKVNPVVEEIIGYSGTGNNQKPITSQRTVTTTVSVQNNETVVLGGLLKETTLEKEEKVFLLGSVPILGALFTHRTSEIKTTDLLILITPRILK